jgi:transposase-like protein
MICKNCGSSKIVKNGKVKDQQRYKCKDCGKQFFNNYNFDRMRTQKHIIGFALDLYYDGMSVRKIQRHIKYLFKVKVSYYAIHKWITKYSILIKQYVDTLKVNLGDIWHVDETAIKIKGKQKWFWEIIDEKTRFMVAEHLSTSRKIEDSKILFKDARNRAIQKPRIIYADGCFAYRKGFNLYFGDRGRTCKLVQNVGINGRVHQNMVERLHGTLKDMLRARRGLDSSTKTEAMLDGWFVYYNFLRPHSSLGGKTPAEVAGIQLDLTNRWESLIDLATKWEVENSQIIS